jgi:hypothetical protein
MRNYRHTLRSIKYYKRAKEVENTKEDATVTADVLEEIDKVKKPAQNIENRNKPLDDFEAEYQAFITMLKLKKAQDEECTEEQPNEDIQSFESECD